MNNKKEYIEREAAFAALCEYCDGGACKDSGNSECAEYRKIRLIQAANVAEVRHGYWINTGTFDNHYTPIYQCSECWKEVADNYISNHKYCLHCGTKMDGGKSNA